MFYAQPNLEMLPTRLIGKRWLRNRRCHWALINMIAAAIPTFPITIAANSSGHFIFPNDVSMFTSWSGITVTLNETFHIDLVTVLLALSG
ncbi:hypothetical protein [Gymnodinialimonas sp. 57CJ19]|uniref:hypothetical protein n=1 Tax=Gymnodinialimonas sp. 57CJ19 TaxID=3138498 RepID=UPI003134334E